ncbi:lysophospholipid acyltransferase 1 [Eucyclogobius newberryi]|uniref:lysophospholipid acyltransferase 1 n=1 Tax=Eucyclogobius newberryi TaxID=166745 RepID=UPI003B5A5563
METAYKSTGALWLLPLSEYLSFPVDQLNFMASQLFALAAAFWFRLYLSPTHTNPLVRHAVATLFGVAILIFCFGWYASHMLTVVLASYLIILKSDINNVPRYTMVWSIGYLLVCQVIRVYIFNYGVLSTDFSGPLMVVVQKLTSVAFQLHDGMCKKPDQINPEQKLLTIKQRPSLIEYLSYNLNFLGVLVGPCSDFKDYIDFMEGRHISSRLHSGTCNGRNGYKKHLEPSPVRAVCEKLLICVGCVFFFFIVTRSLPVTYNVDPDFLANASFMTRLIYAFFSVQASRPRFYFAWTLADAVNNAAGYGFAGMDKNGRPSWELFCNVNILGIETATSFKTFIDNWNIRTGIWLKMVCYDRAPRYRLPLTFVLSAVWHGLYPGYYFTFLTAIPISIAARAMRKSIRPYFLGSRVMKCGYDVVTWAATQLAICYTVMPFLLLAVEPTMIYYRSMYFHVHILSILAAAVLHWKHKPRAPSAPSKPSECPSVHCSNNGTHKIK